MPTSFVQSDARDVIRALNMLIDTCTDGERGYRHAAADVHDAEVKTLLTGYADQRARFVRELQVAVAGLGMPDPPVSQGSLMGALHRGWIDTRAKVGTPSVQTILSECERGELVARKAYEEALQTLMLVDVNTLVLSQFAAVKGAHEALHGLVEKGLVEKGR
ncbi:MAG: PA2169 family four-helix-bundle protein [Myxococcales bacterium]